MQSPYYAFIIWPLCREHIKEYGSIPWHSVLWTCVCFVTLCSTEVGSFLNSEGSALYALQSVCNHSCDPNAMPSFPHSNFQLAMCAVRDIAPGDEILISYLDDCVLERSRHSRHKLLRFVLWYSNESHCLLYMYLLEDGKEFLKTSSDLKAIAIIIDMQMW
jgi:hypothetical protein